MNWLQCTSELLRSIKPNIGVVGFPVLWTVARRMKKILRSGAESCRISCRRLSPHFFWRGAEPPQLAIAQGHGSLSPWKSGVAIGLPNPDMSSRNAVELSIANGVVRTYVNVPYRLRRITPVEALRTKSVMTVRTRRTTTIVPVVLLRGRNPTALVGGRITRVDLRLLHPLSRPSPAFQQPTLSAPSIVPGFQWQQ